MPLVAVNWRANLVGVVIELPTGNIGNVGYQIVFLVLIEQ